MGYFDSVRNKSEPTPLVAVDSPTNVIQLRDSIHPYAEGIRRDWLARLDDLPRPWYQGAAWDTGCFVTARKLIELANSGWSGYSLVDAHADYMSHAPSDNVWDARQKCWDQAMGKASSVALPEPPPHEVYIAPEVRTLQEPEDEADSDPFARFNLIDWHHLKREEDPGEQWIVEPIIAAGRMVAFYSAPKAGKSLLLLELVTAAALGRSVLGRPAQDPVTVLYVDFENDPRGDIKPRLEDMGYDLDELTGRLYVATFPSMARLDTPQGGLDLLALAQHVDAGLVVIDTVSRTVGGEENDNNTWLAFYRNTGIPLKREGIACIRLDHTGKDREKGMRGGSAKYGDVDAVWRLVAESETVISLTCTDHRMVIDTKELTLVRRTDPLRHEVSGDPFTTAMDARETQLAKLLDRLEIPTDWGRDKVRQALTEHGETATNTLLSRVIKARRNPLPHLSADRSRTGADSQPPSRLSGTPHRGPDGGQVGPVRNGQGQVPSDDPDELVSCKTCFKPTTAAIASRNDGLCATCHRDSGQTPKDPA